MAHHRDHNAPRNCAVVLMLLFQLFYLSSLIHKGRATRSKLGWLPSIYMFHAGIKEMEKIFIS